MEHPAFKTYNDNCNIHLGIARNHREQYLPNAECGLNISEHKETSELPHSMESGIWEKKRWKEKKIVPQQHATLLFESKAESSSAPWHGGILSVNEVKNTFSFYLSQMKINKNVKITK